MTTDKTELLYIRVTEKLKKSVEEIAKKKKLSQNRLCTSVLEKFVEREISGMVLPDSERVRLLRLLEELRKDRDSWRRVAEDLQLKGNGVELTKQIEKKREG